MGIAPEDPKPAIQPAAAASDVEPGVCKETPGIEYAEIDANEARVFGKTERGLSRRHVQLIVIGGSIGTGLFVGIGGPLAKSGPLSVFLGFFFFAFVVIFPLMHSIAEMTSWLPIRGNVFHFAEHWIDGAVGFAVGYTYWYGAVMLVCVEVTAVASVIQFWTPISPAVFVTIALACCVLMNIFAVRYYGEAEFAMASLKCFLIIGLMLLTFITMVGGNPHGDAYGFRNWQHPGPMKPYLEHGALGRFLGFWSVLLYAAFACGGPDMFMLISGEVQHPRRSIPAAANRCYVRIYAFYILGVLSVGTLCASDSAALTRALATGAAGAAASPWVLGIRALGITGLDHVVNFAVMTSAWSCGNAYMYSSSRTLYALALQGKAPRVFRRCLSNGVPVVCVLFVGAVSCVCYLSVSTSTATVFGWFVNLGTVCFLITYMVTFATYLRFRKAVQAQGIGLQALYHQSPFRMQPWASYAGFVFCFLILFFNGFDIFWPGQFTASGFFTAYFGVFFFIGLLVFWKVVKKTRFVRLEEIDLLSGKQEIDDEEREFLANRGPVDDSWKARVYDFLF